MFLPQLISGIHDVLLLMVVGVMGLYFVVALLNRLQFRRVLFSWYTRKISLPPWWVGLFFGSLLTLWGIALLSNEQFTNASIIGYVFLLVFSVLGHWLQNTIIITDYAIVPSFRQKEKLLTWGQIEDYFICEASNHIKFVFFYRTETNQRCRFELYVPQAYQDTFQAIVAEKLDARFHFVSQQAFGKKSIY